MALTSDLQSGLSQVSIAIGVSDLGDLSTLKKLLRFGFGMALLPPQHSSTLEVHNYSYAAQGPDSVPLN